MENEELNSSNEKSTPLNSEGKEATVGKISKSASIQLLVREAYAEIKDLFSLHLDTDAAGTVDNINKSIEFRGGNLWGLVFAAFIASIGLNMNAGAVVIGAMLISPLMGPIVGVGYSIATNDFDTLKSAVRNLLIFVVGSVLASMIYFMLSPIKTLTDQLASRTEPTFYDVLIAICGGAIGIVASSRKDRGNAIPGVAIATALMPPLCTVGYGLATGQFAYAGGAFYLFFINSVFIAGTAWVFVRALKFPKKKFLNEKSEKRINQIMLVIVLLTIIPSFYTAFNLIKKEFFFSKVEVFSNYITDYQLEKGMFVGELKKEYNTEKPVITITVMGDILEKDKYNIEHQLEQSGLTKTKLIFREWGGGDALNGKMITERLSQLQDRYSNIIEELYEDNRKNLKNKEDRIAFLEEELAKRETKIVKSIKPVEDIAQEFAALYPDAHEVAYNEVIQYNTQEGLLDTLPLVTIDWEGRRLNDEKKERMLNFFKVRMKLDTLKVVFH